MIASDKNGISSYEVAHDFVAVPNEAIEEGKKPKWEKPQLSG